MPAETDSTQSDIFGLEDQRGPAGAGPVLHVVLQGERPMEPPARHDLADIDVVSFARGDRAARRYSKEGLRHLELQLPDRLMSSSHGSLAQLHGRYTLDDPHSKNGVILPGARVRSARLATGDAFVLGSTVFMLEQAPREASSLDQFASELRPTGPELLTFHAPLRRSLEILARLAPLTVPILLCGATGTGKEVAARALHALSGRRGAFVAVNCGAISPTLLEAELFGHRRGAFSGAVAERPGHLRAAERGTLFLDEIGELPAGAQAALLRALQEREVVPVGDSLPVPVDFRLCAATHRDLAAMVSAGTFREDLYARLMGASLDLPPLRERRCDLGLLIQELLARQGHRQARFTPLAALALVTHAWPRNVRELEHTLTVATALAGDHPIDLVHLPDAVRGPVAPGAPATPSGAPATPSGAPATPSGAPAPAAPPLDEADLAFRQELQQLFDEHGHNLTVVAQKLGKDRTQIYRWVRRFGIVRARRD